MQLHVESLVFTRCLECPTLQELAQLIKCTELDAGADWINGSNVRGFVLRFAS